MRLDRVDDEVGKRLDKEIAPFAAGFDQRIVGDEQRFGFVRVHLSVGPAELAQHQDFLWRDSAVGHSLGGNIAELHGHLSVAPEI